MMLPPITFKTASRPFSIPSKNPVVLSRLIQRTGIDDGFDWTAVAAMWLVQEKAKELTKGKRYPRVKDKHGGEKMELEN